MSITGIGCGPNGSRWLLKTPWLQAVRTGLLEMRVFLLLTLLLQASSFGDPDTSEFGGFSDDDTIDPIDLGRMDAFLDSATSYLLRISHTERQDSKFPGRFTYMAYLDEELQLDGFDEFPQREYNLLRHNGAIYSLALAYHRRPKEEIRSVVLRAVQYLKDFAIAPVPDPDATTDTRVRTHGGDTSGFLPDLLAPWETTTKGGAAASGGPPPKKTKLGGAGLSLIALCNVERIVPGTTSLEYMRQLANFIVFLQNKDGSFTSRYTLENGKDDSWTSLYYPGEAALGLLFLSELETDETYRTKWLDTAATFLVYLERFRRHLPLDQIEPDHWALVATARMLPKLDATSVTYWLIYEHAVRVVKSMLVPHTEEELADHFGCFTLDRQTCPTATRLEGLIAALSFVQPYEVLIDERGSKVGPLRERMLHDIRWGIRLLLNSQEQSGRNNMMGAVPHRHPSHARTNDNEVRIDFVQHSMSAVMAYEAFVKDDGATQ